MKSQLKSSIFLRRPPQQINNGPTQHLLTQPDKDQTESEGKRGRTERNPCVIKSGGSQ